METKTMGPRNLGFVLSEASGNRSYENVVIASGAGELKPGAVLGMVTASDKYVGSTEAEVVGKEGAETATAILAYGVDATSADVEAVIMRRDGEVKKDFLVFDASVDNATKIAAKHTQLAAAGVNIIVR
ncbi:MAG: head decoration protein [Alphaproteobacteria bacterium]|nr:head decoration protein [Alphaproteobacteria bacterium]